jgi:hypothetical protein
MVAAKRKYPVGIQSFESIRQDGYLYIDKTPLIYKMITEGKPYFLSRPRRFGKSLLVSTLAAVFEGRRELFEAFTTEQGIEQPQLFIATTDWKWEQYPVIRFDFSQTNLKQFVQMEDYATQTIMLFEERYGLTEMVKSHSLAEAIRCAHEKTGRRAVVLVDEYDTLMLHSIGNEEQMEYVRDTFSALFGPLKGLDDHLQFVFITGISKFSQMGIFSKLNNLYNISMVPAYETLCGISEEELTTQMHPDIELMAERNATTSDDMLNRLKARYDGYHFSKAMMDMYNPFSLVNAFNSGDVTDYWFDRGTSSALIKLLAQMPPVDIAEVEGIRLPSTAFDLPLETFDDPLPILYQSGYLTIKDFRRIGTMNVFTLGFPNAEVRTGFADCLFRHVTGKQVNSRQTSSLQMAYNIFYENDDLPAFIDAIKTFFAGVPYHWEQDNRNEHFYHAMLYTLLVAFGADIRAEEPTAKGRSDITLLMPKGIYVMELKYDDTADAALEQIDRRGYADKYTLDGRPLTKVGIAFSSEERNITDWKISKEQP